MKFPSPYIPYNAVGDIDQKSINRANELLYQDYEERTAEARSLEVLLSSKFVYIEARQGTTHCA